MSCVGFVETMNNTSLIVGVIRLEQAAGCPVSRIYK